MSPASAGGTGVEGVGLGLGLGLGCSGLPCCPPRGQVLAGLLP